MNAVWLDHYDSGVPRHIEAYPDKTLVDFVRQHARERGDDTALVFKGRRVSWHELDHWSDALSYSLRKLGVQRGDRVALVLPNAPQYVIAELAVWKLGAITAPQNPLYTARELEESFSKSTPVAAIVLTPFYARIKEIQPRTTVRSVIATNVKEYLPFLLKLAFTLVKEKKEGHRIELENDDAWLQELIDEGNGESSPEAPPAPGDAAIILMSGGTTGTPKGAVSDHRSLVASGTQLGAWLRESLRGPDTGILLPLPLFHTYACAGVQPMAFIEATRLILVPNPRDTSDLLSAMQREKPTLVACVPAIFNAILAHPDVIAKKVDLSSIRACFSGAAALMAETKKRFEEMTGGRIVEGYSLTEATMACCINPLGGVNKIGSVGMPVTDVSVRIVDSDTGAREMAIGEVGEVTLNAPQLMLGYWNDPEQTADIIRLDDTGRPWLFTGDLGYVDSDGYVFLVDRKKDLIKTSGLQVWPREIEEVIATHPAVAEVGCAGIPDERKGEVACAWIVLRQGASVTTEEILQLCREKLAPYKIPAKIEYRSELPKTLIGKVLRRALVAEAPGAVEKVEPARAMAGPEPPEGAPV